MNLHDEVCKTLSITRQELADMFGISLATVNNWVDDSRMSKTTQIALGLMLENHRLKEKLNKIKQGQEAINSIEI
ncbi:XRE family transcriptional regulator (plasmid) [Campylobacter fetus]|uniref:XRE family transcriptional regulator n=1 Tax=Campylobacter fetus TaxID=196 RepID=A0A974MVE5_CAMFE|nr:hypothetical protein [Campylobacter fetus]KAA3682706.1 XRE family transcriptional regulator [Campylobacter fetus subsp. venerealis]OCS19707.1 hypothetical protein CFVI03596_08860 [Campylobacter fetus subsp. venerealis cfvi03/596]OCS42592.1 hypothetical protein CFVI02298_04475 [Campylobacter fetus subsp. venerealis cfvi02/298]QMS59939.1 XRE family transcriptional regulator [Campylobacter fetus]